MNTMDEISGVRGEIMRARNNVKRNLKLGNAGLAATWNATHARLKDKLASLKRQAKEESKALRARIEGKEAGLVALAASLGGTVLPNHKAGVSLAVARLNLARAKAREEALYATPAPEEPEEEPFTPSACETCGKAPKAWYSASACVGCEAMARS